MEFTLAQIAREIDAECMGDANRLITGIAPIQFADSKQISFLDNVKYRRYLKTTTAGAVIVAPDFAKACPVDCLVTANPYLAYAKAAKLFLQLPKRPAGIHASACVAKTAKVNKSASIGAHVVIGERVNIGAGVVIEAGCVINDDCDIGTDSVLHANVTLYHQVRIGERARIHSGVVIGADGFGVAKAEGYWHAVPQLGGVLIGNDTDIGANSSIDRGALDDTRIGNGVKIDNLVQIAHNVVIGNHTLIAGCTGISGSTVIGEHCIIGGGACLAGHIELTDNVVISGMSGVMRSIKAPGIYSSGTGAQPNRVWRKNAARFNQLDNIARRLRVLENQIAAQQTEGELDHE